MGKINLTPIHFDKSVPAYLEETKHATFVCEASCGQWRGDEIHWFDSPSLIFYSKTKHPQGSNWFSVFYLDGRAYIANGITATLGTILGIQADDGEIIYSRYHHDFVTSTDGSVWIDGGRDLPRMGFCNGREDSPETRIHVLRIIDDQLVDLTDYSTF